MKIAIQKNGKLTDESLRFMRDQSLGIFDRTSDLWQSSPDKGNEVYLLRDDDIPVLIKMAKVDIGIVGLDRAIETNCQDFIIKRLGFGQCAIVVAVPLDSPICKVQDLQQATIATSFPVIANNFSQKNGIKPIIVPISGSVEVMPRLGLCDAIIDITQTGKSLKQNNLRILCTLLYSQAVLLGQTAKATSKPSQLSSLAISTC